MSAPVASSSGWSTANLSRHSHHISTSSQISASYSGSSANSSNLPSPSSPSAGPHSANSLAPNTTLPDRYICPSCSKAFSRPSSLRIHVHSHTGEKPFRCPHEGCGKAFSVRSNMKRHQRGCHVTSGMPVGSYDKMDVDEGARIVLSSMN
ncbi:MAG: hypothetical protein M1828_002606 [Chrysothrix sp. TS-e1954]|nr:MAG: hypothetical protein M1828_002606 [Chrysothrix sp. TS-e1954]